MSQIKKRQAPRSHLNENIVAPQVRLIDADGEQVGVVSNADAQQAAEKAGLDLVEISPQADPPVCRIMDYGKFVFEESKKKRQASAKQKRVQVKEVKFRPGTDKGDYQVKLRNLTRFLEHGDKVKITVRFRGREMAHQQLGSQLLARVAKDLEDYGVVEQRPRAEGRQMVMIIAPKKSS